MMGDKLETDSRRDGNDQMNRRADVKQDVKCLKEPSRKQPVGPQPSGVAGGLERNKTADIGF